MTKNLDYLKRRFPKAIKTAEQLSIYLDAENINLARGLGEIDVNKVFVSFIDDYMEYKIDPDTLSDLSEKLNVLCQNFSSLKNSRTVDFLLRLADLEVFLRKDFEHIGTLLEEMTQKYQAAKLRKEPG